MDVTKAVQLTTPDADLAELSFCGTSASALAEWTASLPMANTKLTAAQLLGATAEVARLQTDAAARLEYLEVLRPPLEYICSRLDRGSTGFVNGNNDELSELAQRLQTNLTVGYKAVIRDVDLKNPKNRSMVVLSCHRTLADLSRTLLRSCQHYVAPSQNLWLELNQLYALAEQLGFAEEKINDDENHAVLNMSVKDHYCRSLLLASAKPNQLRHRQLAAIFNGLEQWISLVKLSPTAEDSLFLIDLESDEPPRYSRLIKDQSSPHARGLQTGVLVYELEAFLKNIDTDLPIPDYVDASLVNHLVSCWGEIAKRGFRRAPAQGSMKVAVGMSSSHYFISGGVEFAEQLGSTDAMLRREINPFTDQDSIQASHSSDVWDQALAQQIPENPNVADPSKILLEGRAAEEGHREDTIHIAHDAQILDTSPGGYRIQWGPNAPTNMQSGDIMAIREARDERWCIAILRWVRHDENGTQTGVELLAPRAIPVAIRIIQKKGGPTEFTRALLLPELAAIRQPATLITPALKFAAQQKIHVQRQGIQATAQLADERQRTESFLQFSFRMLDGYLENSQIDLNITASWEASTTDSVTASR